ncbi:hypothetical protein FNF27_07513 [Cafeteria roenbergensis]|uniref:F-box domain-containing protein n=1 Tax=Cafeteria roenbergensis TaxID=33653 RepID=A0A5A8DRF1_CAFRO|nr:hypothetical protein FNF27_07513 [Cafeteria roenbergensis]
MAAPAAPPEFSAATPAHGDAAGMPHSGCGSAAIWKASSTGALGHVFGFLQLSERVQAAAVCRAFRQAVCDAFRSLSSLDTVSFGSRETAESVCAWVKRAVFPWPQLTRLRVNLAVDAGAAYSEFILALPPDQLRAVSLHGLCRRSEVVEALAERCEGLESLQFCLRGHQGHSVRFASLLTRCSALTQLDATDCPFANDGLLRALAAAVAAACPSLERLELRGSPGVGADAMRALAASECSASLTSLQVPATHIGDAGVAAMAAACPGLRQLDLSSVRGLGDEGLAALAAAECVPRLSLLGLGGMGAGVTAGGLASLVSRAIGLRTLKLPSNRFCVTDDVIRAAASSCTGLASLNLRGCGSVSDAGLLALATARHATLTSLELEFCIGISDAGVEALAEHCTALEAVSLRALVLAPISLAPVRALVERNTRLRSLIIGQAGDMATLQAFAASLVAARPDLAVGW